MDETKKIPCAQTGKGCDSRRIHHEEPFTPRGVQMVEVPMDVEQAFCSMECAMYGGALSYSKKEPGC